MSAVNSQHWARPVARRIAWVHFWPVVTLFVVAMQAQWGIWHGLDLPRNDESEAITRGIYLSRGDWAAARLSSWNQPLYPFSYAAVYLVTGSLSTTVVALRLGLSVLSVFALYALLARSVPRLVAFAAAAWFAVSLQLIHLNLDRTDYLTAITLTWTALAVARHDQPRRMLAALALTVVATLYRLEYVLVVAGLIAVWAAGPLYRRLPGTRLQKSVWLALLALVVVAAGAVATVALIIASPTLNGYFTFVFANNRNLIERGVGIWGSYTTAYGPTRSVQAILARPGQLASDLARNVWQIVRYTRQLALETTWFSRDVRMALWLLALTVLSVAAASRVRRDWASHWRAEWATRRQSAVWLLCLLALLPSLIVFTPLPVYMLVLAPLILGGLAWMLYVIARHHVPQTITPYVVVGLAALLLAPSVYAGRQQPFKELVSYVLETPGAKPLRLAGFSGSTLCNYVGVFGRPCENYWWSPELSSAPTYEQLMARVPYDWLIVEPSLGRVATEDAGWQRLLAGNDPQWHETVTIGPYRVFAYVPGP